MWTRLRLFVRDFSRGLLTRRLPGGRPRHGIDWSAPGPPADWVRRVRAAAPELLDSREGPQATVPPHGARSAKPSSPAGYEARREAPARAPEISADVTEGEPGARGADDREHLASASATRSRASSDRYERPAPRSYASPSEEADPSPEAEASAATPSTSPDPAPARAPADGRPEPSPRPRPWARVIRWLVRAADRADDRARVRRPSSRRWPPQASIDPGSRPPKRFRGDGSRRRRETFGVPAAEAASSPSRPPLPTPNLEAFREPALKAVVAEWPASPSPAAVPLAGARSGDGPAPVLEFRPPALVTPPVRRVRDEPSWPQLPEPWAEPPPPADGIRELARLRRLDEEQRGL
jgi:hypothetical protein